MQPVAIEHLLLIAGPSGAGKSTFIDALINNRLPEEIAGCLPKDAKKWPRTSAKEIAGKGLTAAIPPARRCRGLVVHYDIMRPYSKGYDGYEGDAVLTALTTIAVKITVTTVLPPPDRLLKQYLNRANRVVSAEGSMNRYERLKYRAHCLTGGMFRRCAGLKPEQNRIINLYRRPRDVNRWAKRWYSFLHHLRHDRTEIFLISVAPGSHAKGPLSFHLTGVG